MLLAMELLQDDMAMQDLDNEDLDAGSDGVADKGGDVDVAAKGSWKRGKSMGHMSMAKSMRMTAGQLVAGVSGECGRAQDTDLGMEHLAQGYMPSGCLGCPCTARAHRTLPVVPR